MYGQQEFVADGVVLAATQGLDALGEAATQGLNALGGAAARAEAANAAPAPLQMRGADRVPSCQRQPYKRWQRRSARARASR